MTSISISSHRGDNLSGVTEDGLVIISNSEVQSFLTCEMKHYFAHILGLEPKTMSTSLARGIIGHEALAAYYEANFNKAAAKAVIVKYTKDPDADIELLGDLWLLLNNYFTMYADDKDQFRVIEVESAHTIPMDDTYTFGMRLDLLVEFIRGPRMGRKALIDHKFSYDFPNENSLSLNAQLPKYLATLVAEKYPVSMGIINTLRWRKTKENEADMSKKFRRDILQPTGKEMRNVMHEHYIVAGRIGERKSMSTTDAKLSAVRNMNLMTCRNCPFVGPCKTDLMGESIALTLQTDFQKSTYGYSEERASE